MPLTPEKAARFQQLHAGPRAFVIANPWDVGSAKLLVSLGFPALTTSSGASAAVLGKKDGQLSRDEALAHAKAIADAVDVPVAADLEKGFGDAPADAAETIRRAVEIGLAGGSIEDATRDPARPIFDFAHAVERIAAAVEAARASKVPFVLTARCENLLGGRPDLDDTIRRLQAYEKAGADVLFAPGLPDLAAVKTLCASVTKPVNFMIGMKGKSFSVAELEAAGVRRVSLAASLYRYAMMRMKEAAGEILAHGTFGYVDRT
jgi:2-methylisocitrate lyase-like PEP mutase family enzyme